jgi:hypothetical protein
MLHPVKNWADRAESLKVLPSFKKRIGRMENCDFTGFSWERKAKF